MSLKEEKKGKDAKQILGIRFHNYIVKKQS